MVAIGRGSERSATLVWGCGLKRSFCLHPTSPAEEFKLGALPMIRVITSDNFLWLICMAGQTPNYWTSALLTLVPSEATGALTHSLAQNVMDTSFNLSGSAPLMYVGSLSLSCIWGSCTYICDYIWLFFSCYSVSCGFNYLDQMKASRRVEESFFLSSFLLFLNYVVCNRDLNTFGKNLCKNPPLLLYGTFPEME